MRSIGKELLLSIVMGMVLPGMLLNFAVAVLEEDPMYAVLAEEEPTQETERQLEIVALPSKLRHEDGTTEEMDMDTYLVGVVLAEMPAYFEEEALKAQAVVART